MAARDSLIEDLSKRYEQMREDFKYNLDLIEHRDAEISRLNRLRKVDKKELEEKEADNKSLTSRLAALERKEYDLQQSIATERTHFKASKWAPLCRAGDCHTLITCAVFVCFC